MKIPDEAVEAAARAEENALYPGAWDELSNMGQNLRKNRLRPIVEASARCIAAQAWDECADFLEGIYGSIDKVGEIRDANHYRWDE